MILVTGGTGLLGAHLLYHLLQNNEQIRATHRKNSRFDEVKKVFGYYTSNPDQLFHKIEWIEANITELPALEIAFRGITKVYHCAAFISFNPKHFGALKKANIEGTANIVNLCIAYQIKKLCYVSSIATLGTPENKSYINEETPWNQEEQNSVYSITKYGAEMEVWRGSQEGLDVVIVNPGIILGEGFWNSGSGIIIKKAAKGFPYFSGGATGFVDVKDVVTIMLQLMKSTIKKERFVLVAKNMSYQDFIGKLSLLLGKKPPQKKIPQWILFLLAHLDGLSNLLFKTRRSLLKTTVKSMYTVSKYDATKVKKRLEYTFIPIENTLERITKVYCKES